MEIVIAFIIFGAAVASLVSYMKKEFKKSDACSSCNADKSRCGGSPKRGKC